MLHFNARINTRSVCRLTLFPEHRRATSCEATFRVLLNYTVEIPLGHRLRYAENTFSPRMNIPFLFKFPYRAERSPISSPALFFNS